MGMEYFTYENMQKIHFQSTKLADETLRVKTKESGFELAVKDPISGYCRYYCIKGGKKRRQTLNKTDVEIIVLRLFESILFVFDSYLDHNLKSVKYLIFRKIF